MNSIPKALSVEKLLPSKSFTGEGIFAPTATSRVLCSQALSVIQAGNKVLDLGCGSGVIGLEAALQFGDSVEVCMSDISTEAIARARENCASLNLKIDCREGSLFDPWGGMRFDDIISDVSGVIPGIGAVMGWFDSIPNDSGADGAALAVGVLTQAPRYLLPGGSLLMPVISLSDERSILRHARTNYASVERLVEVQLPLPSGHSASDLKHEFPCIRVGSIGKVEVFFTSVWRLSSPIKR